jgi:flagellar P-ring protein precursor FlgI
MISVATSLASAVFVCFLIASQAVGATRIKDVTSVRGVRANALIGYGLVIGLNGTGDSSRNSPFTQQSIQSMLDRMGVNVRNAVSRTKNAAAVMVTAELPPFAAAGSRIDVSIASLGDATSLAGGTLILTGLSGPDQVVYASAQGPVAVSGFASAGRAETLTQGVPTAGRIANGALIERSAPALPPLIHSNRFTLDLTNPDFTTSVRIADAINAYTEARYKGRGARADNLRSVSLIKPPGLDGARYLAEIGELAVEPDVPARVVIDERTGTVVLGRDVTVSTVAVAHGNLTVRVTETPRVVQPQPFSQGETAIVPRTAINAVQDGGALTMVRGASLQSLVASLNRMGVKPQSLIAILQAIKAAGALQAELVVQ